MSAKPIRFVGSDPSLENYWRAIILFGKNSASYKFALAKSLYDLHAGQRELIRLEDLAVPFSRHVCDHVQRSPRQGTAKSSQYLDTCRRFNCGEIDHEGLVKGTIRFGFQNVIDAFHVVNGYGIPQPFFIDERATAGGIRLTDTFFQMTESAQYENFAQETEARWRLVEEAWRLGISTNLIALSFDDDSGELFVFEGDRRTNVTSCRDSLNGYQKGRCFYCFDRISIVSGSAHLCEVDHFLPWAARSVVQIVNGVWNLVLACEACNSEKLARVPVLPLLERLHRRNEYFIDSHLPLRETLIRQTGATEPARRAFLQSQYNRGHHLMIHLWQPAQKAVGVL
jgi:hypothetical protein